MYIYKNKERRNTAELQAGSTGGAIASRPELRALMRRLLTATVVELSSNVLVVCLRSGPALGQRLGLYV